MFLLKSSPLQNASCPEKSEPPNKLATAEAIFILSTSKLKKKPGFKCQMEYGMMIINYQLQWVCWEMVVVYFEVIAWHFHERTKENVSILKVMIVGSYRGFKLGSF
jgi:hypothetical protein